MVCLTSCVFRSIRFSGFARPHFGVRREGELYTRPQGEGKRSMGSPRDAHKSGNDSTLGALSRPRKGPGARPARALGAQGRAGPGRTARRAHYSSGQALRACPYSFLDEEVYVWAALWATRPAARARPGRPAHALQPRHLYSPPPSTPVRPPIESLLPSAQPRPSAGSGPVARAIKSLRDIVLTGSPTKRSLVPSLAFYINALSCREYRLHHRTLLSKWLVNGLNTACHSPVM